MRVFRYYLFFIASITLLIFANSCSKDENNFEFEPVYLTDYEHVETISRDQILGSLSETGLFPPETSFLIRYGIKGVRITYKTISPSGEEILASGALLIPDNDFPMPLLSFQHGTITEESSAPSNFQSEFNSISSIYASTGYIIALPDYIGYGASMNMEHPYEHRISLATATRDMIRASYEYFKIKKLNQPNNDLFLSGYSEGGFATMATYKLLQEEHSNEFNISGVTVGAGAYNKTEFVNWIIESTTNLEFINYFVWVLDTYNSIYPQLQRPYNYYFNEPWATTIANQGVFASIETNPSLLFNHSFIEDVETGVDNDFISAIDDNNCYSWLPESPLQLYHGTDDTFVPYFNSESAYNSMVELGADNIELITIEGGDHFTSVSEYATGTFLFFQSIQNK
jgi:pimeloyl-ACP methyl ester carboxylesterase